MARTSSITSVGYGYDRTALYESIFLIAGNSRKLTVMRCRFDLRKYCFTNRIVNMWNSLPDNVTGKCMILYLIIAPTLLKPEVWHELIRIVKIKRFK